MSVAGFVADRADGTDRVFAWYANPSAASGALLQEIGQQLRAIVVGRRTFDTAASSRASSPAVSTNWPSTSSLLGVSFFETLGKPLELDGPRVVEGDGATHLA